MGCSSFQMTQLHLSSDHVTTEQTIEIGGVAGCAAKEQEKVGRQVDN